MTDLIKLYQDQQDALGDGCGDGNCVIKKPVGMHTNGGCRCLYNLDFMGRQRVGVMLQVSQKMAGRIEDVVKERDGLFHRATLAEEWRDHDKSRAEAAEAKLTKAVEMLILCRDMFDEVAHPSDPLSVMIKTTLAELEGKE